MQEKKVTPLLVNAKSVITSSPNRENYKDFEKSLSIKHYYMPTWSYDELLLLHEHCYNKGGQRDRTNFERKYAYYGGVPRFCINVDMEFNLGDWERIINDCSVENVMKMIGRGTIADSQTNVINHRLIHIIPNANYESATLQFGSQKICDAFLAQYYDCVETEFIKFIETKTDTVYASLRGQLFEAYAHRAIAAGGEFLTRNLAKKEQNNVTFPATDIEYFSGHLPTGLASSHASSSSSSSSSASGSNYETKTKYFIPHSKNYAVVDSLSNDGLFQMTVSEKHPLLNHHLQELLRNLTFDGKPSLYFVVPEDKFENFELQNYNGIDGKKLKVQPSTVEQIALCIKMSKSGSRKKQKLGD